MKCYVPYLVMAHEALLYVRKYTPSTEAEFLTNSLLQDAICMRLQVAGENFSKFRRDYPKVFSKYSNSSWYNLIGVRNIISHGYAVVDMRVIWKIITVELSPLIESIERLPEIVAEPDKNSEVDEG